ncbi:ArnT family glycosyltransferase [Candidatus Oscillochloris fontis]|uniref:ArnT family glycosyltransferase n=1 Tax=Candidatus Oscillochloris fontis TaxID=2496868 RepID=UPI00101CE996|nr:glycosyltransferase family 39 protein [Candidatus Oscillochloris fontis]
MQDIPFHSQRYRWGLVLIVIVAIILRVSLWWWGSASGVVPPGDAEEYYRAAVHILQGGYHDDGKWLRPPGYPVLLALILPCAGMDVSNAMLIQAILMGVGALAFSGFARQIFGRHDVALVAGMIGAIFIPLATFASALYAEALFVTLMILGLTKLDQASETGRSRTAFFAGIVLAAATLTRAVGLFFIPLAALFLIVPVHTSPNIHVLTPRRQGAKPATKPLRLGAFASTKDFLYPKYEQILLILQASKHRWRLALALALGATLLIGPWALRNYLVHDHLILVDTNGGISVWFGQVRNPEEKAARDAELFAIPNLAERQALANRWTLERVQEDPVAFVVRMRYKVASLLMLQTRNYAAGDLIAIASDGSPVVQNAGELSLPLTLLADAEYIMIMLAGMVGIAFAPNYRRALPALLWAAITVGLVAISIGHPRLRLPLVAVYIPFAAYALMQLAHTWRKLRLRWRDPRLYAALLGILLFLGLIASTRYITWIKAERYALQAHGAASAAMLIAAQQVDPSNPLRSIARADFALAQGQADVADQHYQAALDLEGRSQYARAMRILLAGERGDTQAAEAELAAINAYWRAGNDLYRWAWEHVEAAPPQRVIPGDPMMLGFYRGFAPASFDLERGAWTLGKAEVRLRTTCGAAVAQLRGVAGQVAELHVQGSPQPPMRIVLDGSEQEVQVSLADLPGCERGEAVTVQISSPTHLLDLARAPWYVGVAVTQVETR